ncbi:hypothetical protein ACWGBV_21480 [Streptomyces sp. NPDC055051]
MTTTDDPAESARPATGEDATVLPAAPRVAAPPRLASAGGPVLPGRVAPGLLPDRVAPGLLPGRVVPDLLPARVAPGLLPARVAPGLLLGFRGPVRVHPVRVHPARREPSGTP